jgi:hypothetical protein
MVRHFAFPRLLSRSALAAVLMASAPLAETEVAGTITTTTWTSALTPFVVTDTIRIPAGETLTIEPGVDVLFRQPVPLFITGSLMALGSETDSIRFMPEDSAKWCGIRISGGDTSSLAWTRISGGVADYDNGFVVGGGISVTDSNTRVYARNSVVADGFALSGGGIYVANARVTLQGVTLRNNWAHEGAGLNAQYATIDMADCVIRDNRSNRGGGISVHASILHADRCLFADNVKDANWWGGGASAWGIGISRFTNCTFVNNTDDDSSDRPSGGGLFIFDGATVEVENSIVWGNSPNGIESRSQWDTVRVRHSISQEVREGIGNLSIDPLLTSDYTLDPGSPAIDAGDPYSRLDTDGTRADMGWTGGGGILPDIPQIIVPERIFVVAVNPGTLNIRNDGAGTLEVTSIALPVEFSTAQSFPVTVPPLGGLDVSLMYNPVITDTTSGIARVVSSDPFQPTVDVKLYGVTGTLISGDVVGTWNATDAPYHVLDTVRVSSGNSLIIEAGVDVLFDSNVPFDVQGSLHALGTEFDSVRFLQGFAGQWRGLSISGGDTSLLQYTRISGTNRLGGDIRSIQGGLRVQSGIGTHNGDVFTADTVRLGMEHCVVSGNRSRSQNAGIGVAAARLTMISCIVRDNAVGGGSRYGRGGGVSIQGGVSRLTDCIIERNVARSDAGLVYEHPLGLQSQLPLIMERCVVRENTGEWSGGVDVRIKIFACLAFGPCPPEPDSFAVVIEECLIANNAGGGLSFGGEQVNASVDHCTITDNTYSSQYGVGGGLAGGRATVDVENSIVWGNSPSDIIPGTAYEGDPVGKISVNYTDVGGASTWDGAGNLNTNPLFVNAETGEYSLLPGSPCVDAGNPYTTLDLDGTRADMGWTGGGGNRPFAPEIVVPDKLIVGTAGSEILVIQNTGSDTLVINDVSVPTGVGFSFHATAVFPCSLAPNDTMHVVLDYTTPDSLDVLLHGYIASSDAFNPSAVFGLHGLYGQPVEGVLSNDTLSPDGGPVRVTGHLYIPSGDSLYIAAGTDIRFDFPAELRVEGALNVDGTEDEPVEFQNYSSESWRGIRVVNGSVTVRHARIEGAYPYEHVNGYGRMAGSGGGIGVVGSESYAHLSHVTVTRCRAYTGGGIGVFDSATVVLDTCNVVWNRQSEEHGKGGGIYGSNANIEVNGSVIASNSATPHGDGGGVFLSGCTAVFRNTVFSANVAANGGALDAWSDSHVTLVNCTVSRNVATWQDGSFGYSGAGGLLVSRSRAVLVNTIVWGNESRDMTTYESQPDVQYSCIGSPEVPAGDGNIGSSPLFVDAAAGDYRLLIDSPCINSGDPSMVDLDGTGSDMGAPQEIAKLSGFDEPVRPSSARPILHQNVPNPFNPVTTITYTLPGEGFVSLSVYNVTGQRVSNLVRRTMVAGMHSLTWDGTDDAGRPAASGLYVYRLVWTSSEAVGYDLGSDRSEVASRRMLLLR